MDVAQRLPSPLYNHVYPLEVAQYSGNHSRELTSAGFPPLVSTQSPLEKNNVALPAVWRCKADYRKLWRDDVIEWTGLDIQIIKQNVGVFHRVVQKLLIKCISLQRQRYSIYIPSWTDTTIRIHDASCGHYRTDHQNTTVCSAAGRCYHSTRYRCQKDTHEPTQNSVSDSSLKQLGNKATLSNIRVQQKVRSQIQTMKLHWLNMPWKHQQRLEASRLFILVLDKHLRVMFVSENVSRHLGYQQEDILGRNIGQFIHPRQMSDMLRLTRGRHYQTDDKHCFPLWKTGKVITVAMKFCLQTARTGLQDTGYKPVLWTVNLRLRKRGHCVRAQDVVILCKPVHDCTATSLRMSENMLINPSDLSFNFHVCNFSCELAKRTLHHKTKNLNGIKCLCLGKESDLLYVNHHETNHLKKISHNCLIGIDSDLILKQLLQSFRLHLHVCSCCISKWWTKMNEISSNHFQSSDVNSYASMALKTSRSIYKNYKIRKLLSNCFTSSCRASYGFDSMCSFSAACISRFTKARTILHHEDEKTQAVIKMFNTHSGKSLSPDLEPNQKCCSSQIPLQTATSFNFLTQASAFSDIDSPHLLMKASLKQENTPTDELMSDKADVSTDSKSTCQDVTDVVLAELGTKSQPESPTEISVQKSFIYECIQSPAEIITGTKQSGHSLPKSLRLPLDCKDESTLQLSSCQCHSYASSICNLPGHVTSESCSKTESSSLSSILQMENISPLLVRKKINEDVLLQTCPTVSSSIYSTASSSHTVRKRSNTLLHSFLLDCTNASAYNSGTLCNNVSPPKDVSQSKSSNVHHQASPAATTLGSSVSCWSSANNQMSFASTSTCADDDSPVNSVHSQEKVRTNNKITSLLTKSTVEQAGYVNTVHRVSSKMANQKSDPFLSQASFSDFNFSPNTDMFDDLASETCSLTSPLLSTVTSQIEPGTDQEPQSHHLKDQFSSSNFQTFLDPVPESTSFVSESLSDLDSLLNTIPVNHATSIQTSFFSGWPESDASQSSDSMSLSNYFFNDEAYSRPSLLRKLLNKEGSDIQEPANDAGWIVDQIGKKNSDVEKTKIHYGSTKTRYTACKQVKNNKSTIQRSVELPKIRLNQRQMMQFNKFKPQFQKPTKELPLPSSIKATGTSPTSALFQQDPVANRAAGPVSALDKEMRKRSELGSSDNANNCELPDDLIDMAVECCAPLELDQTEALISDLNDSCSWEDNLYSLLEFSGQENSGNDSGNESPQQTSKVPAVTCQPLSNFSHLKDSFSTPSSTSPRRAESSFMFQGKSSKDKSKSSSSQTSLPSQKKITSQKLNKISVYSSDVPKVSTTNCSNTTGKMSLLRAAITSDVDKLIEQIPLRNASKTCILHRSLEERKDDPDIQITKVTGLKENHNLSSTHRLYHKVNKVITARPLETTSKALTANTAKPPETTSLCKSLHSSKTAVSTSCNALSPPSVQTFKTNVSEKSCDKWKLLQNGSSCEHCGNTPKIPSIINPFVIKISIGSSSAPKVVCANSGSVNNLSQHLKPDYQNRVCDKSSNSHFCRAPKSSSTDLSSTQPVSVMIMRKENHRSRRSKSIAIQTDNEPDEVYPEFEHNPSDTILYPSTIIMYPSAVLSPQDISPVSTPLSSHSSISDIDKFLPSHPSMDDSSSSADDDYRTISSTPFLWKLLTGELSKDRYQRLDQQMLEKERKKSLLQ